MRQILINSIILLSLVLISCSTKIQKTGYIDTEKFSSSFKGLTKGEIISILGPPSSIDPIDNNLIYFSEIKKEKNIFNKKILSRNIYVIKFNKNNIYTDLQSYKINDSKKIEISKKTTDKRIIKTGWIERLFGGVGTQRTLPQN